jgi:hypothetical protein
MREADLILREIPYGKRRIKYSYDVIENNSNMELRNVVPSKVVLSLLSKGYDIKIIDENNNSYVLGKESKR